MGINTIGGTERQMPLVGSETSGRRDTIWRRTVFRDTKRWTVEDSDGLGGNRKMLTVLLRNCRSGTEVEDQFRSGHFL